MAPKQCSHVLLTEYTSISDGFVHVHLEVTKGIALARCTRRHEGNENLGNPRGMQGTNVQEDCVFVTSHVHVALSKSLQRHYPGASGFQIFRTYSLQRNFELRGASRRCGGGCAGRRHASTRSITRSTQRRRPEFT